MQRPDSRNYEKQPTNRIKPDPNPQAGAVSGKLVVPVIFGFAVLLAGIVFWNGKIEKRHWDHVSVPGLGGDTENVVAADSLRVILGEWPREWLQVTRLGEKFAVVIPCYSETPKLTLSTMASGIAPRWVCPFCETSDSLSVQRGYWIQRKRLDSKSEESGVGSGPIYLEIQGDSLPWTYFPAGRAVWETPSTAMRSPALLLIRQGDSAWFFPSDSLASLEVIREEDENPEGCQSGEDDLSPSPDEDSL